MRLAAMLIALLVSVPIIAALGANGLLIALLLCGVAALFIFVIL